MAVLFYNLFLVLLKVYVRISSLFNEKSKKWLKGRKNIFQQLADNISPDEKIIWVHCSSLGEFEQGRPLMEELKNKFPDYKLLLTFFSPSGYEAKSGYEKADWVFYLPVDGPRNAKRFLEIVHPSLVIFVKYEFWYYYLKKIKYREIPLFLVSALFRKDMSFFQWYGKLQRKMLSRFDHLFVQNEESKRLIDEAGFGNICSVSGDTRFDRVIEIAERFKPLHLIEEFITTNKCIVAGSTWKEDEEMLEQMIPLLTDHSLKLIIAPHEITERKLTAIQKLFPDSAFFSDLKKNISADVNKRVLIIDNIGMLSRLYKYAHTVYIGGGFTKSGIHNVLEAAVYGKPVIWGSNYKSYSEAIELIKAKGGFSVNNADELKNILNKLLSDENFYANTSAASKRFVEENAGATKKVIDYIQEKRLLIS